MINFQCQKCGLKITTEPVHAGKNAKCPKCGNILVIPTTENDNLQMNRDDVDLTGHDFDTLPKSNDSDEMLSQLHLTQMHRNQTDSDQSDVIRKFPWLIDVLCYPISVPGLIILGIFVFTPTILSLAMVVLSALLGPFSVLLMPLGILSLIINIIVIPAYMFWYFGLCIRQSASGQIRAPETLSTGMQDDFPDMAMDLLRIICCVAVYLAPALIYYSSTKRLDWILWSLLGLSIFLMPMALLGTIMFSSFDGLNPLIIIGSIFSTLFGYCASVLALCVPVAIALSVLFCLPKDSTRAAAFAVLLRALYAYLALVVAHILGRFYYRNAERLYWEV